MFQPVLVEIEDALTPAFIVEELGDGRCVVLVAEREGSIRILRTAGFELEATPFLTVENVDIGGEGGLLGLAFHPEYATNGFFYVCFTIDDDGGTAAFRTRITRYQVSADPDVADPESATQVLNYLQPQTNNNGGWIGFGPDGLLYIAIGDGGGSAGHVSNAAARGARAGSRRAGVRNARTPVSR